MNSIFGASLSRLIAGLFFVGLSLYSRDARAGTITLTPEISVSAQTRGERLSISGSIVLTNNGDEDAEDTFPSLVVGGWRWVGEAKAVAPKASVSWDVAADLSIAEVGCEKDPACAGRVLPTQGMFPLVLWLRYADAQGYRFSTVDLRSLQVGDISAEQRAAIRTEQPLPLLKVERRGNRFDGAVEVYNPGKEAIDVSLSLVVPEEMRVSHGSVGLSLQPGEKREQRFQIENVRGLPGSSYIVGSVVQWARAGARGTVNALARVDIVAAPAESSPGLDLLIAGLGLSLVVLVGIALLRLRRIKAAS